MIRNSRSCASLKCYSNMWAAARRRTRMPGHKDRWVPRKRSLAQHRRSLSNSRGHNIGPYAELTAAALISPPAKVAAIACDLMLISFSRILCANTRSTQPFHYLGLLRPYKSIFEPDTPLHARSRLHNLSQCSFEHRFRKTECRRLVPPTTHKNYLSEGFLGLLADSV